MANLKPIKAALKKFKTDNAGPSGTLGFYHTIINKIDFYLSQSQNGDINDSVD